MRDQLPAPASGRRPTLGPRPFVFEGGRLHFRPAPSLPARWFTESSRRVAHGALEFELPANSFACALLGSALLVYHNEDRRDTFGANGARPALIALDGELPRRLDELDRDEVERLRNREIGRVDIWLK